MISPSVGVRSAPLQAGCRRPARRSAGSPEGEAGRFLRLRAAGNARSDGRATARELLGNACESPKGGPRDVSGEVLQEGNRRRRGRRDAGRRGAGDAGEDRGGGGGAGGVRR